MTKFRYTVHRLSVSPTVEEHWYDPDDASDQSRAYEWAIKSAAAKAVECLHRDRVEVHSHVGDILWRITVEFPARQAGRRNYYPKVVMP